MPSSPPGSNRPIDARGEPAPARRRWRLALALGVLASASACGGQGCAGCGVQPVPGGFPKAERIANAIQIRLSDVGLRTLEKDLGNLVANLSPTGSAIPLPATGCDGSSDQKFCCTSPCTATMDFTSVALTPKPASSLDVKIRAQVSTSTIRYETKVFLLGWVDCDVTYKTDRDAPSTLGINGSLHLINDASGKLRVVRGDLSLDDFDCGDIDISGGISCTIADWFCGAFKGSIESSVVSAVGGALDDIIALLPTGHEGRLALSQLLAAFSPGTDGVLDYSMWAENYAEAENSGLSIGGGAGFRAPAHHPCVPDCERPGATCKAPAAEVVTRSYAFRHAKRPNGSPFDIGLGVHRAALDRAAYAIFASGGLCLDLDTDIVSELFGLLVPSLGTLNGDQTAPILLRIRPRQPPTVELGAGTYHVDDKGNTVIDEPLLSIAVKEISADVYALLDDRYVRVMTGLGDLVIPMLLTADANGDIVPLLGDVEAASSNERVENAELLAEDPQALAKAFPTLVGIAANTLASKYFKPLRLLDIPGVRLEFHKGSFETVDSKQFLAIFSDLAVDPPTQSSSPEPGGSPLDVEIEANAELFAVELPPTVAFSVGGRAGRPVVKLGLGVAPGAGASGPSHPRPAVEWSYRIDGGLYRPWVRAPDGSTSRVLEISDPVFWLQGRHTVEVIARVIDRPGTTSRTPRRIDVLIDTVGPRVKLERTATGVRARLTDAVSGAERLELAWSIGGAPYGAFDHARFVEVAPEVPVAVKARDEAGNLTLATAAVQTPPASDGAAAGCAIGRQPGPCWPSATALVLLLGVALGRRRRRTIS